MSNLKAMYKTIVKEDFPETMTITLGDEKLVYRKRQWEIGGEKKGLRYGENPDQPAALYELVDGGITLGGRSWRQPGQGIVSSLTEAQMIQAGKHPGKTNLTDVDNGANILQYLTDKPAALIIKHNNPCGAAWSDKGIADALEKAFWCDRIAAFGGAIVVNRPFTKEAAELVAANYFEVVAAPSFEDGVVDILKSRKNLRIMELPGLGELEKFLSSAYLDIKCLSDGGLVVQKSFQNRILSADDFIPAEATDKAGNTFTARRPTAQEFDDLRFAWAVESGVTSNSVIFAHNGATTAIGHGRTGPRGLRRAQPSTRPTTSTRTSCPSVSSDSPSMSSKPRPAPTRGSPTSLPTFRPVQGKPTAASPVRSSSPTASSPSATAWMWPWLRA